MFDDVKYKADPYNKGDGLPPICPSCRPTTTLITRPATSVTVRVLAAISCSPVDSLQDMRSEMLTVPEMGIRRKASPWLLSSLQPIELVPPTLVQRQTKDPDLQVRRIRLPNAGR